MRRWMTALVLALGSSTLGGCANKTASLSVFFADTPSVSAANGKLDGGFQRDFIPGPEVSASTTVTLGDFPLQSADGTKIVDPLRVDATDATFPITISPGDSKLVTFTINSNAVVTQAQHDAICAGQVVIVGSVTDSALPRFGWRWWPRGEPVLVLSA